MISKSFFGMMYQGSSVHDGVVQPPYYPIQVGVQRLWDTEACMTFMGVDPIDVSKLDSQMKLAQTTGARPLFTFGFSGDPNFPPPAEALQPGSNNIPEVGYLVRVMAAVMSHGINFAELGNEPSIANLYWDGTADDCYWRTDFMYKYIKSHWPSTFLLSPSLCDLLEPSSYVFAKRYTDMMRTYGRACDAIAFHMYPGTVDGVSKHLDVLDRLCSGLGLAKYCTEFNGPWEAFDIMANRGIKLVILNGQQPPGPYENSALSYRWNSMVTRITTQGPTPPKTSWFSRFFGWLFG